MHFFLFLFCCCCCFSKGKRERLYFLLGIFILTSKCYVVRKIMFQKNLEKVDVPLFGNSHDKVSNAWLLLLFPVRSGIAEYHGNKCKEF